ncbi:MAG: mechanosensitive ion channel family protein [Desulfocapsa sp.]|nr:mechanosensitive ion channel family protein [Desulfocapsa sp.]
MTDNTLEFWLIHLGLQKNIAESTAPILITLGILTLAILATWIVRRTMLPLVVRFIHKNRLNWDDPLIEHKFFHRLSWLVPLSVIHIFKDLLLEPDSTFSLFLSRFLLAGVVIVATLTITALINTINDIFCKISKKRGAAIRGYTDVARIVTVIFCAIFLVAILTGRSPWGLLSLLGGLTAVILLVFKDSLLGFVAHITLSTTDMIRIGDWIEMKEYGADGDVIEMSIHCVRVQNWDKTVTTIPTYALIANSFKNWRGMSESGGRRIKRAINIDLSTIHFMSDEEIEKLGEIQLLEKYLRPRQKEIEAYNTRHGIEGGSPVNGRNQTNIGIFRAYTVEYLRQHPQIHSNMTFLVRHLAPTETGLPLEIYVFSKDQVWANYEAIQADIFDHLLAALPYFDLRVFQNPTSFDFKTVVHQNRDNSPG